MEWVLIQEPPPEVPVPFVASALPRASTGSAQHGVLIAVHWMVDGKAVAREIEFPVQWPRPSPVADRLLRIDLGTVVAPVMLETRVFRALNEDGLPQPPASAIWCRYLDTTAVCRITRDGEDDNWHVVLDLPAGNGDVFVSMRGEWGIPADSPLTQTLEWPVLDAGWIFSVTVG